MWILLCFDRVNDVQSNHAVVSTEEDMMNFMNTVIGEYKGAKIVMVPKATDRIHRKMFPIITSEKCDFYAQWFNSS